MMRLLAAFCFVLGTICFIVIPGTVIAGGDHWPTAEVWRFEVIVFIVALLLLLGSAWCWRLRHNDSVLLESEHTQRLRSGVTARALFRDWCLAVCFALAVPVLVFIGIIIHG